MSAESIAVIGLGNLGTPVARNLLADGFSVSVYNRSRHKAEPLAALGARVADSPATLPNTHSSASEFEPRRLAPWMPTLEHSPAANSPRSGAALPPSTTMPPIV